MILTVNAVKRALPFMLLLAVSLMAAPTQGGFLANLKSVALEGSHTAAMVAGFIFAISFSTVLAGFLGTLVTGNIAGAIGVLIVGTIAAILPLIAAAVLRTFGSS